MQLAVRVGQDFVVERLFGGRAKHQGLAGETLEVPDPLAKALRWQVLSADAEHGQAYWLAAVACAGDRCEQAVEIAEGADQQAAVFQLMLQGLA
ncbi:hypothetical protein D3C86_1859420 [compost metagenome]